MAFTCQENKADKAELAPQTGGQSEQSQSEGGALTLEPACSVSDWCCNSGRVAQGTWSSLSVPQLIHSHNREHSAYASGVTKTRWVDLVKHMEQPLACLLNNDWETLSLNSWKVPGEGPGAEPTADVDRLGHEY